MSKDSGVKPVFPHVATKNNSSASTPLRGVANLDSPTARLEVTDTGRSNWSYDLPFVPISIPRHSDYGRWISMFEIIKRTHIDTIDNDASIAAGDKEAFDASDITCHRGFLLKASLTNPGDIYVTNKIPSAALGSYGNSTNYLGNTIGGGGTTGTRQLIDANSSTSTGAYLTTGATAYPGMPLSPGEALFIEITSASNIYLIPSTAGCVVHWLPS